MVKKICLSDLLIVRVPGLDYPGYLKQNKNQPEPFKSKFDLIQRDLLVTLSANNKASTLQIQSKHFQGAKKESCPYQLVVLFVVSFHEFQALKPVLTMQESCTNMSTSGSTL